MKKYIMGLVALALLSACAPNNLIKPTKSVSKKKGIILASVTKSGGTDVWFYYKKKGSSELTRMDAVGISGEPDSYLNTKDKQGRLLAFEVDEGTYYLTNWEIYSYYLYGYSYISPKKPKPLPFTVKSGRITYIGNLHVDVGYYNGGVVGLSSIKNRRALDIKMLKRKYPNLRNWPIKTELPNRSKWKI